MTTSARIRKETFGFLTTPEDTAGLIAENRLQLVLVRMGNGRFICPVQDLDNMIAMVSKADTDYVRDVSLWS
jgi:hypothetical protein